MIPKHIEGAPIGVTGYRYHGCRCGDCRAAATEQQRRDRRKRNGALIKVQSRYNTLVLSWANDRMTPATKERLRAQAYADLGIERRPSGRPRSDDDTSVEGDQ